MVHTPEVAADNPFDVVVFLHGGNWFDELTSNRWHYVSFFDQFVDVIIVQPTGKKSDSPSLETDTRLNRTRVLFSTSIRPIIDSPKKNARRISEQLSILGYERPLFWLSSPLFWNTACHLQQGSLIFHATEDYRKLASFNPHPAATYIKVCAERAAEFSDITVSVSDGVTKSLQEVLTIRRLIQSSNGYSSKSYGPNQPQSALKQHRFFHAIVFCGNINKRIDFELLKKIADSYPHRTLILAGPVSLDPALLIKWKSILDLPNVLYLGSKTTSEINWLYLNSATGIIPYIEDPVIVESGFPLKALEMTATGLPIVSTHMKPLVDLHPHIHIAHGHQEFLKSLEVKRRDNEEFNQIPNNLDIHNFSYEVELPRVFQQIVSELQSPNKNSFYRKQVRFSLFNSLCDSATSIKRLGIRTTLSAILKKL